jgi:molecular chaperone DnaJ
MGQKRCYYEVLGIHREADPAEIKKAYRRLAMDCHPDRNPGDHRAEDRFKELSEAYEVLSDHERRGLYDRFGHDGPRQAGFQGFGGIDEILSHFADFFGGSGFGGFSRGPARGQDLQIEVSIPFADAAKGATHPIELERKVACDTCGGSGAKAGTRPDRCGTCGGRGQVAMNQGLFMISTTCPTCRGQGQTIRDKCVNCHGSGLERKSETVKVQVPAGIDDGQTLRVSGKGQASPAGGPPGNLFVTFHVEPDPRFERDGDDLFTDVQLTYSQAVLGTHVRVPTLDEEVEIKIPAGTQPGTIQVLRGRGMPNVHGRGVGDLAVRLRVVVPKKPSDEERRLIEQLALVEEKITPSAPMEEERGFFFKRKKKKG